MNRILSVTAPEAVSSVSTDDDQSLVQLERAIGGAAEIVAGVGSCQRRTPTECDGLDAEQLMLQMVNGLRRFARRNEGSAEAARYTDLDQMAGEFRHAGDRALASWRGGVARRDIDSLVIDQIVSGRALAKATGQVCSFDDDLILWALNRAQELEC